MRKWPTHILTAEEFAALPQDDDWKEELLDGVICRFPPGHVPHGFTVGNVSGVVTDYCKPSKRGRAAIGCGLIVARNPDSVLAPDVVMFPNDRPPDELKGWPTVPPVFVAEVVDGPADYYHVMSKVSLYLAFGVDLIWVVRPPLEDVLVYRLTEHPGPIDRWTWPDHDAARRTHLAGEDVFDGGDVLPGFRCKVSDLFA